MASASDDEAEALLTPPPEPSSFIGSVIGHRYRVEKLIGHGGMGAVFLAEHVELGTPVALKVLIAQRGLASEDIERFMREARSAVKLTHRNIVRVFDLGRMDDGTPFMAMERLEGNDLEAIVNAGEPLELEEVLAILEPIASAIDAVHAEGLVHRDIKPANIFLSLENEETVPKLLDFGLAQLQDRTAQERLTGTGLIVGTPHYLAPEVGVGADPDSRSDQYSLAAIAYELLCGKLPFDGPNPTTIMVAKVGNDPPRLPGASDAVWNALARGLARQPPDRYESCNAMMAALAKAAIEPSAAATITRKATPQAAAPSVDPEALSEEAVPEPPRSGPSRTVWGVGAALLLLAVGVVLWAPWSGRTAEQAAADTTTAEPVVAQEANEPEAVSAQTGDMAGPELVDPPTPPPSAMETTAETTMEPTAETTMAPAPTMDSAMAPPTMETEPSRELAPELTAQGQRAMLRGQLARAARLFREATYNDSRHAPAWRGLGIAEERMGHAPEARRAYRRYLRLAPGAGDASAIRQRLNAL